MSQSDNSITLNPELSVPDLLRGLLERWYISERKTLLRALEQTTPIANNVDEMELAIEEAAFVTNVALKQVRRLLETEIDNLSAQDSLILKCWARGDSPTEIASQMNVSVKIVYHRLKILQKRVLYRSLKLADEYAKGKVDARASRLQAFEELQRSLSLTSAKATEWQDAIHEARR